MDSQKNHDFYTLKITSVSSGFVHYRIDGPGTIAPIIGQRRGTSGRVKQHFVPILKRLNQGFMKAGWQSSMGRATSKTSRRE